LITWLRRFDTARSIETCGERTFQTLISARRKMDHD
jgi:hypothetical protein